MPLVSRVPDSPRRFELREAVLVFLEVGGCISTKTLTLKQRSGRRSEVAGTCAVRLGSLSLGLDQPNPAAVLLRCFDGSLHLVAREAEEDADAAGVGDTKFIVQRVELRVKRHGLPTLRAARPVVVIECGLWNTA